MPARKVPKADRIKILPVPGGQSLEEKLIGAAVRTDSRNDY